MFSMQRPLEWIGRSHKDLMALPVDVRRFFGFALSLAQSVEVIENDAGGTYRAVYTVKYAEAVFVLHCFQKKSKRSVATPKEDMDIIHTRLKIAQAYVKEIRK